MMSRMSKYKKDGNDPTPLQSYGWLMVGSPGRNVTGKLPALE
jgi:hypothetical protein